MQDREFYDVENGIHSMKIPRTGRYQLILAGYGYGDSKGAKIQMDISFIKGVTINFFIRKGVFVFTDFDSQSPAKIRIFTLDGNCIQYWELYCIQSGNTKQSHN